MSTDHSPLHPLGSRPADLHPEVFAADFTSEKCTPKIHRAVVPVTWSPRVKLYEKQRSALKSPRRESGVLSSPATYFLSGRLLPPLKLNYLSALLKAHHSHRRRSCIVLTCVPRVRVICLSIPSSKYIYDMCNKI